MPQQNDSFDPTTENLIRKKARRLCQHPVFTPSDQPDNEQEQRLHLHKQGSKVDPSNGGQLKYVSITLDNLCVSIFRYRTAAKRTPEREECSLNDSVLDADGREVDLHQVTPNTTCETQDEIDRKFDLEWVRRNLLSDLQQMIVPLLAEGRSITAIARELKVSPDVVQRSISDMRGVFEDASLRDYL